MHASNRPLAGALKTTADTLTTRQLKLPANGTPFDKNDLAIIQLPSRQRPETGH